MTLAMPDSTYPASLPDGFGQYLGYTDGLYPTVASLRAIFPDARIVGLTVTGATLDADGCDIEQSDLTPDEGAQWARQRINRTPGFRPVLYASVSRMGDVLTALAAWKIGRAQVRLLSAHWAGEHICGPGSCGAIDIDMDGTQWTRAYPGENGGRVDMSALFDGFFGTWTEEIVGELPLVQQGDTGGAVRTVQGLLVARGLPVTIDGIYGAQTMHATEAAQMEGKVAPDGIVGPQTWPVLLGIA